MRITLSDLSAPEGEGVSVAVAKNRRISTGEADEGLGAVATAAKINKEHPPKTGRVKRLFSNEGLALEWLNWLPFSMTTQEGRL